MASFLSPVVSLLPLLLLLSFPLSGRTDAEEPPPRLEEAKVESAGKSGGTSAADSPTGKAAESSAAAGKTEAAGAPQPLRQAHAHNDYQHARPLLDALDCGFLSVEADIYAVDGDLLVGHEREELKPERSLRNLYLRPLAERAAAGGGKIYPGAREGTGALTLLIDIKDGAAETWPLLRKQLEEQRDILTEYKDGKVIERAVTVILSGDRPVAELSAATQRLAFLDGRPKDLEENPPASLVPWVSASWSSLFAWRGQGEFPEDQRRRFAEYIAKAHQQGRKVRFWGVYDEPFAWEMLRKNGVDILGTDKLPALRDFLRQSPAAN